MNKLIAVIHGILTGQTEPSWPDRFDAWMFQRDRHIKVLKSSDIAKRQLALGSIVHVPPGNGMYKRDASAMLK